MQITFGTGELVYVTYTLFPSDVATWELTWFPGPLSKGMGLSNKAWAKADCDDNNNNEKGVTSAEAVIITIQDKTIDWTMDIVPHIELIFIIILIFL